MRPLAPSPHSCGGAVPQVTRGLRVPEQFLPCRDSLKHFLIKERVFLTSAGQADLCPPLLLLSVDSVCWGHRAWGRSRGRRGGA